jgi:hypothetical protein
MTEFGIRLAIASGHLDHAIFWMGRCRDYEVMVEDLADVRARLGQVRTKVLSMLDVLKQEEMENANT